MGATEFGAARRRPANAYEGVPVVRGGNHLCGSDSRRAGGLRRALAAHFVLSVVLACAACGRSAAPEVAAAPSANAFAPTATSTPDSARREAPTLEPASPSTNVPFRSTSGEPCGALECRRFASEAAAFEYVLESAPLVLGIGEAHALAGTDAIRSTARRFGEELLPVLERRASHLIVELLQPNARCQTTTREVEQRQLPVTREQSDSNQNDYVELGHRARSRGIEPFVLSPTCDELAAISNAGEDAIEQSLITIADITLRMALGALTQNAKLGRPGMVVAYGGALHNDEAPDVARAQWSYGPRLVARLGGRYTSLDLIVREFIKDTDVWRSLAWYQHFDPERDPESTIVMRTGPHGFVLFFPSSKARETLAH